MKRQQLLLLSLAVFILIISGGYFYYQYEKKVIRQEKYNDLKTIANLKINQITQWRGERLADAHVFTESPFIQQNFQRWLLSKDNTLEKDLLKRFSLMRYNYNYEDVFIVSAEGKLLLGLDTTLKQIDSVTIDYCKKALRDRKTFFSDFYFCPTHDTIHFDIIAPVSNNKNVPVAVLVLRVNPYDYLYPLITSWPTASETSEGSIVRKDGDGVLFLNELKFTKNTALRLRFPLSNKEIMAVKAVSGLQGIYEGEDYRGVKVLADIRPVPGSPWFMIAKTYQSEVFSELNYRAAIVIIITLILLLFLGVGISWLYNNRQKNIYKKLLESETALQNSQEEFRTTLYSIGDAVITTDIKGCIRNMNVVAEKLTGWKEKKAKGKILNEVFHIVNEETLSEVENPIKRVLLEGVIVGLANHTLLISKDRKQIPIADSGAPIKNTAGDITGVVLVFRDQTEERAAQKALQESERKFRETVKYLDEGYYSVTPDGLLLDHNQAFNSILGIDIDQNMKGAKLPDFWQNPDNRKVYLDELITKGFIRNYLINAKKINGKKMVVIANAHLLKDKNDKLVRIEGTFTDFTERKRAEDSLQRNARELAARNRIAQVFLTVPDEEMYAQVLTIILEVMNSKFGVFGFLDELGGLVVPTMTRTIWDKCQVSDKRFVFPHETWSDSSWPTAIRQKRTIYSNEPSTKTPEGHITITKHISLPLIHKGEVVGLVQVANKELDYTDEDVALLETIGRSIAPVLEARLNRERQEVSRKQAEERLKISLDDLKRSNEELEQFAYVASHDLQEPLRMVSSFTQLFSKRYTDKLDKEANEFMQYIVDGANRMQQLIQDLLSYSRITTRGIPFTYIDTFQALGEAIANLQVSIKENASVITNDDLPVIMADHGQIVQLFQNLIGNSIKFRSNESPRIHISAKLKDDEYVFSVKDNGIGIDPAYFERIFVIFQRLHAGNQYPGTGIGLAICDRIVQRHSGKIWVESEPGKGSVFYFTLKHKEKKHGIKNQTN